MTVHLYARVSTEDKGQNPEVQLRPMLAKYHYGTTYVDRCSAVAKTRPEWERLQRSLMPGDTIVVWKLDRAFRSVKDFSISIEEWKNKHVQFDSLTEMIDTTTAAGMLLATVMAAFAQFERAMLSERTKAGMKLAKSRGKHVGRPRKKG